MRVLFADEAQAAREHVRLEMNATKTELQIGTTTANNSGFIKSMPVYTIDRERVRTLRDMATAVNYYAKVNRVSSDVTASYSVTRAYRLNCGTTVKGEI